MSLLHRSLLASNFLERIEPIVKDTIEAAVAAAIPGAAPLVDAGVEALAASLRNGTGSRAPDPAASSPLPANLAADKNAAALAAVEAVAQQLANLATQLAMLKSNLTAP